VLVAGNTAMDAGTVAKKLGAEDIYIVYRRSFVEMPAWKSELNEFMESGGHFLTLEDPQMIACSESVIPVDLVVEAVGQALEE
jgi:glutamate synthase (NADPH/NADH) small chain